MKILLTGAHGLLGTYIRREMAGHDIVTLGRREAGTQHIVCDLTADGDIALPREKFDLVVHAAGTTDPLLATELNLEGTRRLLRALDGLPAPGAFTLISCSEVYSDTAGEMVDESRPAWPTSETGSSKIQAEKEAAAWCERHGVPLTILRPATMFGRGMKGWAARMFAEVAGGRYIHVRGNDSRLSVVTALDVARVVAATVGMAGIFNVTDGREPCWLDLAEAMSANTGNPKRMITLPGKWAAVARRTCGWLPAVRASLDTSDPLCGRRFRTLTFDTSRLRKAIPGWHPYDTLAVLARTAPDYPYEDD